MQDFLLILKGQRFINAYPQEITVFAKALYLLLTTLLGARTLGEEYVDLVYVSKSGRRLPKFVPRLGFILSYAILPYLVNKVVKKLNQNRNEDDESTGKPKGWLMGLLTNYHKTLDTILNIHIALFYFKGEFYSLSKRIFGLRYAFGHNKDEQKIQRTGNYSLLGGIMILQFVVKFLISLKNYNDDLIKASKKEEQDLNSQTEDRIENIEQLVNLSQNYDSNLIIDLSDEKQLPYLPENSRNCMLCLSPMVNPSAANCGHLFCWDCIVDWIREHPECPLCRQQCLEQHLLPLK